VDPDTGEIIWMWRFIDHTIQDRNPAWPNYVGEGKSISDYPGKLDIFWKTDASQPDGDEGVVRDWHHCNSLNYNEDLDLLAINAKHWSEFYVIDHGNTFVPGDPAASFQLAASDAGDFIYRFGNPSAYKQGDPPGYQDEGDQQMYGSHNIQWIKKRARTDGPELPGAGNFLIFNNGCYNPGPNHSEVIEINPFLDAEGNDTGWYVNPPDAGYDSDNDSNQIVWLYESERPNRGTSFYARHISGCERQPNGNTLIMAGTQGHMFEVTEDGEVVWEYQEPINQNFYRFDGDSTSGSFRVHRYSPDYPGLAGRDLTPGSTLTGRIPVTVVPDIEPVPITGWGIPPGTSSEGGAGDVGEAGEGGY